MHVIACGMEFFVYLCTHIQETLIFMTGVTVKRNSVSDHKTAVSCGLTLSAAIQPVKRLGDNPSAAAPETVIIGDRGLQSRAANSATQTASSFYILYNIYLQNLRQDDHQNSKYTCTQHHARRRDKHYHVYY